MDDQWTVKCVLENAVDEDARALFDPIQNLTTIDAQPRVSTVFSRARKTYCKRCIIQYCVLTHYDRWRSLAAASYTNRVFFYISLFYTVYNERTERASKPKAIIYA